MKISKEKIEEHNKLIAKFMNLKLVSMYTDTCYYWSAQLNDDDNITIAQLAIDHLSADDIGTDYEGSLKFHRSFDWIMAVIEQIENNRSGFRLTIRRPSSLTYHCILEDLTGGVKYMEILGTGSTKLEAMWNAVITYLKWINYK